VTEETYYRWRKDYDVSRATMFRWLKRGILQTNFKAPRGWRLFTEDDLHERRAEKAAEMGRKGKEWVNNNHSYEVMAREVEAGFLNLFK